MKWRVENSLSDWDVKHHDESEDELSSDKDTNSNVANVTGLQPGPVADLESNLDTLVKSLKVKSPRRSITKHAG
jgi:hypothetical protein